MLGSQGWGTTEKWALLFEGDLGAVLVAGYRSPVVLGSGGPARVLEVPGANSPMENDPEG